MKTSQNKQIYQHFKKGRSLTSLEALNLFGCLRLASRINDLRREGIEVKSEFIKSNGKRFKKYWI